MAKYIAEKAVTIKYPAKEYDILKSKIIKSGLKQKSFNKAMLKLVLSDKEIFEKVLNIAKGE
jgi:hypothetical protein